MDRLYVGRLGFLLLAANFQIWSATNARAGDSCEFKPVLIEDFNSESIAADHVGPERWMAHTPWYGDFGDARFTDPGPGSAFKVENGILSITAVKDAAGKWSSGLIASADGSGAGVGTRYGYFEARMKMPKGPGTWPAFWLASLVPVKSPVAKVEIDVIEYYGHITTAYNSVVHVWLNGKETMGIGQTTHVPADSLTDDYHNFGVDISPQALVFFLDGKKVWSQPTPPELNGPMYPLVNLALGSGWPIDKTPNPSTLLVDYVHIYGRDAGPPEGCPPGPPTAK